MQEKHKKSMEIILLSLIVQLILFQLSPFFPLAVKSVLHSLPIGASEIFITNVCETAGILAYLIVFFVPMFIIKKYTEGKIAFHVKPAIPKNALSVFFTALGGVILIGYATFFFRIILETVGIGIREMPITLPDDVLGTLLVFVSSVLVPAVVEELLYRGVLLHSLLPYGKAYAIIISSLAFSIMHCNPTQFLYAFFGGIMFSFAAIKSNSVFFCIILHFANNCLSFIYLLIHKYVPEDIAMTVVSYVDVFFIVSGLLCFCLLMFKKYFKLENDNNSQIHPYKNTLNWYLPIYLIYALFLTSRWFYII